MTSLEQQTGLVRFRVPVPVCALMLALLLLSRTTVEARTHTGARWTVPEMVERVVPVVVSITTRHIEHDQFGQAVPHPGVATS